MITDAKSFLTLRTDNFDRHGSASFEQCDTKYAEAHCCDFGVNGRTLDEDAFYLRAPEYFIGTQAPSCLLLVTHCWMKYMPSAPS